MIKKLSLTLSVAFLIFVQVGYTENFSSRWNADFYGKSRLFATHYDAERSILHLGWQLRLNKNWKTYWRSPGQSGLPPRWNWKEKSNIRAIKVLWPLPKPMRRSGVDSYVYAHEVILPLELIVKDPHRPVKIDLSLDYMVCSDICVPRNHDYFLSIHSVLNINASRLQKKNLEKYRALVPKIISQKKIKAHHDPTQKNILAIFLDHSLGNIKDILIEKPDAFVLKPHSVTETKNGKIFNVRYNPDTRLTGSTLTLTLITQDGQAFETYTKVTKSEPEMH